MVDFLVPLDNDWGNVENQQYPCLPSRVPSGAAAKRRQRQKKASGAPSKEPTHTEGQVLQQETRLASSFGRFLKLLYQPALELDFWSNESAVRCSE